MKASDSTTIIGMIHLSGLSGSPQGMGMRENAAREAALRDAEALVEGGVHAMMIENFGDVPFYPGRVPAYVVAQMTAIAAAIRARFDLPLGINVLRNDGLSALAVAHAVGAGFIRVNILCGARVADQGILQGIAHDLLRERAMLGADRVKIYADVDVKHSAPLAARSLVDEVDDTLKRGMADALIVSGAGTGKPTDPEKVAAVKQHAGEQVKVFVGSGATIETAKTLLEHADGLIVGMAFKSADNPHGPVDADLVRGFMDASWH